MNQQEILDSVFSIFVRTKDLDERDRCTCFTCGEKMSWRLMQAGHFIPRRHRSTRWHEKNVHPQCVGCNVLKEGNLEVYATRLIATYGPEIISELTILKNKTVHLNSLDISRMIEFYRKLTSKWR